MRQGAEPRLRAKLLAWLLGPLLGLLAVGTAVTYWTSLQLSNSAYDRSLYEIAREVALHVKANGAGPKLDISSATERVLLVDQDDHLSYKVTLDSGALLGGDAAMPAPGEPLPRNGPPLFYNATLGEEPVRMVAAWLPYDANGAGPGGTVLVQVSETLHKRSRLAWEILANVVVPQLLLIVMAVAAVTFGVARGLAPLNRLKRAVSDRSHRDLRPIELRDVPGEVRPLVEEVNELMLRLGKTLDFQNRFIADAAHQLKTPVSGLKAQIELALRDNDLPTVRHSLAQLYFSADRLSRLVSQLLSLARNEPGAQALHLLPLNLDALALDVSREWAPQAIRRGIDLGYEAAGEPVMIDADADRLRELVNNLIDNAVRYSREGGRVTVAVARASSGEGRLSISDDGPRIPVDERTRIFQRFHRLLGTQTDGSGLGLAIVSEIANLHGARIALEEDSDGIGNTFSVFFPPLQSQPPAAPPGL